MIISNIVTEQCVVILYRLSSAVGTMMRMDTPKSMFLNFASRFVERRANMMPTLILFPTIGLIVTTSLIIIGLTTLKYQNRRNSHGR
ncbi:MAG TPA: hypothetical protein VK431_05330 [Nitrosopumilaceae archaeon]|nr:hypothetical protein [Nitrosopumilaceae archaeon]